MITGFDKTMFDSAKCLNCADSFFIYKYTRTGQRGLGLCDCNNLIHRGQSATTCLLTQQVGFFLLDLRWFVSVIGKPEVRGLTEAAGYTYESAWTHLVCCGLSRGREEGRGLRPLLI